MKNRFVYILILLVCTTNYAQEEILCPWVTTIFKIENEEDILEVADNGDGPLTLTHPTDTAITELFGNYEISVFEKTFPSTQSVELMKYYNLGANSKQLFVDIDESISDAVYGILGSNEPDVLINSDFIELVDGNEFRLTGSIQTTDLSSCSINCDPSPVGDDINIRVSFSYNPAEDLLTMETLEETSCGNLFSVNLSGGVDNGFDNFDNLNLQTWSVNSGLVGQSTTDDPCYAIEQNLYGLIQTNCSPSEGNLIVEIVNEDGIFHFLRPNALLGEDRIEFRNVLLSVPKNILETVKVYQIAESNYLQIHNPQDLHLFIEIFDLTGKRVISKTSALENISIAQLSSNSICLVQIEDKYGNTDVIKFIKR